MSGWWGLLQFSTSHLPRRLHFLARCSVSLGQQKQSFFSLAKWAWWFTPRALKASQFSIWLLCEQIRLGFSRWESVASIDTEGNRLLGLLCVWLYFPPILSSLGDGLGGPWLVGCSLTDDALARTRVCNQMSRSFNYGTLGLISIFLSPQQPLISLGRSCQGSYHKVWLIIISFCPNKRANHARSTLLLMSYRYKNIVLVPFIKNM